MKRADWQLPIGVSRALWDYVHDPAKTVAQAIKEAEKTVGAPIAVTGFIRYALGEGVEKPAEEA